MLFGFLLYIINFGFFSLHGTHLSCTFPCVLGAWRIPNQYWNCFVERKPHEKWNEYLLDTFSFQLRSFFFFLNQSKIFSAIFDLCVKRKVNLFFKKYTDSLKNSMFMQKAVRVIYFKISKGKSRIKEKW